MADFKPFLILLKSFPKPRHERIAFTEEFRIVPVMYRAPHSILSFFFKVIETSNASNCMEKADWEVSGVITRESSSSLQLPTTLKVRGV